MQIQYVKTIGKNKENMKEIKLYITNDTLLEYEDYYFKIHPKAHKKPISTPYHTPMNPFDEYSAIVDKVVNDCFPDGIYSPVNYELSFRTSLLIAFAPDYDLSGCENNNALWDCK